MNEIWTPAAEQAAYLQLTQGLNALEINVDESKLQQLMSYLALLLKWNRAYNLTALKTAEQMVSLHLLDSLSIAPYLESPQPIKLLDVGTGAGLPGLVLAILFPHWQIVLLDSNGKKMRFLFQVKSSLNLDNVTLVNQRVELYDDSPFELISSRAFASIDHMVSSCKHLLAKNGRFVAMKGQFPQQELDEAMAACEQLHLEQSYKISLPKEDVQRHLLMLKMHDYQGVV